MDEYSDVPNHLAPNADAKKPREFWIFKCSTQDYGDHISIGYKPATEEQKEDWGLYEEVHVIEASYAKELEAEIERLKSERDAAVEALRFYANPDKWWSQLEEKGYMVIDDSDKVNHPNGFHGGKRARAVLARLEDLDKGEKK